MALHNDVSRISCVVMLLSWGVFSILPTLTLHRSIRLQAKEVLVLATAVYVLKSGSRKLQYLSQKL